MRNKNNKGFSLVEIVIAVAVFAILIVPLSTALVSAVRTHKKSTKKQYAVEKAEEIMESVKTCKLSDNFKIADGNSSYNYGFTLSNSKTETITLPDSKVVKYKVNTYTSDDKISLGKEYAKYDCSVVVDSKAYAVSKYGYIWDPETGDCKKDGDDNYILKSEGTGTVRNLDNNQAAIITGATYLGENSLVDKNSLDSQAYQNFIDAKLDLLKTHSVYYNQYLSGHNYFEDDTFDKTTTIKVSNTGSSYLVQCIVKYVDKTVVGLINNEYKTSNSNVYYPDTAYGNGIVYQNEYDVLPPIYLLYSPATYGSKYCKEDYINVDTTGLKSTDLAKIYVFESVADVDSVYEEIIKEQFGVDNLDDLVYSAEGDNIAQSNVKVRVNAVTGNIGETKVYSNFPVDQSKSDINVLSTSEDENDDIYYYDIKVTLTGTDGVKTTVTGTRGKK